MTTAEVSLVAIHSHPLNPRRRAAADPGLLASVRQVGVLSPVTLAPHPTESDAFVLIAGHRRLDAARRADLTEVPAVVRDDLVTDAQQVEAMLIENLHRTDLTPVEEAAGYEQLELFGMRPAAIAKATGRPVAVVKERLQLRALSDDARDRLHVGDVSLLDAMTLLEFSDMPAVMAELEGALGTPNFAWKVRAARDARDRAARNSEILAGWEADGIAAYADQYDRYDPTDGPYPLEWFTSSVLQDPAGHPGCVAYVSHGVTSNQPPLLVCSTPATHGEAPAPRPTLTVVEDDPTVVDAPAAALDREAAFAAASNARLDYLVELFTGMFPLRGNEQLAAALAHADLEYGDPSTPAGRLDGLATLLAIDVNVTLNGLADRAKSAAAWEWLIDGDYEPSDVDLELIAWLGVED